MRLLLKRINDYRFQHFFIRHANADRLTSPLRHLFNIPHFDKATEQQFWQEFHPLLLRPLKAALLLSASIFIALLLLDAWQQHLLPTETLSRLPAIASLILLYSYLHRHPRAINRISGIAKLGIGICIGQLLAILVSTSNTHHYASLWPTQLPLYFFSYGQLFMSIPAAIGFGWVSLIALPLCGYWIGVDLFALTPSVIGLLIANIFGLCTRCQLETYSRQAFQARHKAQQSVENKAKFIREFSHNLRQPLQALSCFAAILETAFYQHGTTDLQHLVGKMGATIDDLNNSFNHILEVANLETGKQTPKLSAVDLNLLLASLEDEFAPLAANRKLNLKVCLRTKPPYCVYSDAILLRQILSNLIDNAIKYTSSGWIVIAAVKIDARQLKLHICDSGVGIAKELLNDILKENFRGRRRQNDHRFQGQGIGLSFVAKASEHLPNHKLRIDSRLGQGSDFQLYLPAINSMPQQTTCPAAKPNFEGKFILIIDDDILLLKLLSEQLTAWGCLVQTASSRLEVQSAISDNLMTPDLLISDYFLDNLETTQDIIPALQSTYGPLPTIIFTAHAISTTTKTSWPQHTLLLRKPASAKLLMSVMNNAMNF